MPLKVGFVYISKVKKVKSIWKANTIRTNISKNGQKTEPLKSSDFSRSSIVAFSIFLFILHLKSSDPYKKIFKSLSLE